MGFSAKPPACAITPLCKSWFEAQNPVANPAKTAGEVPFSVMEAVKSVVKVPKSASDLGKSASDLIKSDKKVPKSVMDLVKSVKEVFKSGSDLVKSENKVPFLVSEVAFSGIAQWVLILLGSSVKSWARSANIAAAKRW